ncbi:MAG: hypothetical protein HY360_27140 [Verrucomicrobia bacterium]|nr:hypothetical protein [Verrucomicrobiota bacterium]
MEIDPWGIRGGRRAKRAARRYGQDLHNLENMTESNRPPIYTVLSQLVGWTLDRTADIPKNARFTFGQRIDNLTLDALQMAVAAIHARGSAEKLP